MTIDRIRRLLFAAAVTFGALAATIWYAVARGQDFNWDQRNYHIGVPFLLAHGTFWDSISPAGIQSYFNPYVLQIQFAAMRHLSAVGFAMALAVVQSLSFMLAGLICADIARPADGWKALLLGLLGFALCLMAPMSLSEAGTTFIDLVTAMPIVAAYAVLLTRGRWLGFVMSGLLAGALLGMATALKLTNGLFVLGVAGFGLAGPDTLRMRVRWVLACGIASILAFAAIGGSWQLALWTRFASPLFPYYNNIFHSPDFAFTALRDTRFLPHSILDVWRYPLYWLTGGGSPGPGIASPSSEQAFIDARWILAVGGVTVFLVALAAFGRWRNRRLADPVTGLFFAFVIDYLAWLAEFGIQRYVLPLDVLCGAIILALTMLVRPYALRLGLLLTTAALSWQLLLVPDWGHLAWRPYWQAINPKPLDFGGPSIVFLTAKPSSFIAASLPVDARYVGIYGGFGLRARNDTRLTRQLKQELASAKTQLKEVDEGAIPGVSAAILASYGLTVTHRCEALQVANARFRICNVRHKRPPNDARNPVDGGRQAARR